MNVEFIVFNFELCKYYTYIFKYNESNIKNVSSRMKNALK